MAVAVYQQQALHAAVHRFAVDAGLYDGGTYHPQTMPSSTSSHNAIPPL